MHGYCLAKLRGKRKFKKSFNMDYLYLITHKNTDQKTYDHKCVTEEQFYISSKVYIVVYKLYTTLCGGKQTFIHPLISCPATEISCL